MLTLVLVVCAGVLGAVGGRILLPIENVEVASPEGPRVMAEISQETPQPPPATETTSGTVSDDLVEEPQGPGVVKKLPRRPKRPRTERPTSTVEPVATAEPVVPSPPPPTESVEELAKRLTRRARGLKETRPDKSGEIDLILGDIALETASGDPERARKRLRELARRLDGM